MVQAAAADDTTRGRPYYDKLRKDLKQTLAKKRDLDNRMTIENTIQQLESNYLEETSAAGNIIRGFDNYIKASGAASTTTSTGGGTATRRKGGISDADRIFSKSSVGWNSKDTPALTTTGNGSSAPSNVGTPAANTPTGSTAGGNKGGNKNKKKVPEKETDDERPAKRGKVTWGRD